MNFYPLIYTCRTMSKKKEEETFTNRQTAIGQYQFIIVYCHLDQ